MQLLPRYFGMLALYFMIAFLDDNRTKHFVLFLVMLCRTIYIFISWLFFSFVYCDLHFFS